ALQHEVLDDAVEDDAVVERLRRHLTGAQVLPLLGAGGETDEVVDRDGGVVAEQVDLDVAEGRVDRRDSGGKWHSAIVSQAPRGRMGGRRAAYGGRHGTVPQASEGAEEAQALGRRALGAAARGA